MKPYHISLILIIQFNFLFVQNAAQNLPEIEVTKNTVEFDRLYFEDEEDHYSVEDIIKDGKGFIWMATKKGLFRYDGRKFISFRHIPGDSTSLAENTVLSICKGKKDEIWILTPKYINKLDLNTFTFINYKAPVVARPDIGNIYRGEIFMDDRGILYAGYWSGGMIEFDPDSMTFRHFYNQENFPVKSNTVTSFSPAGNNKLWVGTHDGLFIYNRDSGTFNHISLVEEVEEKISYNQINSVSADEINGYLWIGTNKGLIRYSPEGGKIVITRFNDSPIEGFEKNIVESVTLANSGEVFAGTRYGFHMIDPESLTVKSYFHRENELKSLQSNYVRKVFVDDQEVIWIAHHSGTVSRLAPRKKDFNFYRLKSDYTADQRVFSVYKSDKDILFGTETGLHVYNRETGDLKRYSHNPDDPWSISNDFVSGIQKDSRGKYWVATDKGGINRFDPETGRFENILSGSQKLASYSETDIWYIHLAGNDHLWCGTGGSGLLSVDTRSGSHTRYTYDPDRPESLSGNFIGPVIEDEKGNLWVGTVGAGLNYFDPVADTALRFFYSREEKQMVPGNTIVSLSLSGGNELWIGTKTGIKILDTKTFELKPVPGKISDIADITGIIDDGEGKIWISTGKGIYSFSPDRDELRAYRKSDGIGTSSFIPGCHFRSDDGEIFFGSSRGFISFYPSKIRTNKHVPPVYIINFMVYDSPHPGYNVYHDSSGPPSFKLPYNQNNLTFSFASLDFFDPQKNRFRYRLKGFDENWIYTGEKTEITYNNLPPGEYSFQVAGSNNDNIWNEMGDEIHVVIAPPFWETILFRIGLLGFILTGIGLFINIRIRSIRNQKLELKRLVAIRTQELETEKQRVESKNLTLEKQKTAIEMQAIQLAEINKKLEQQQDKISKQAEKLEEINRLKSGFFANISHEFRTPLTLIINALTEMKISGTSKDALRTAERNSQRLHRLIEQLLDLTRIETGFIHLTVSEGDAGEFLRSLAEGFSLRASSLDIRFQRKIDTGKGRCFLDWDKLEKIVYNLLSNAFKYTSSGGQVTIAARVIRDEKEHKILKILIEDTGRGILPENQEKVFSRFYREISGNSGDTPGTGIGLSLVKQLVKIHRGEIKMNSVPGEGTRFDLQIPVDRNIYNEKEISSLPQPDTGKIMNNIRLIESEEHHTEAVKEEKKNLPVFLFVDDNHDLCNLVARQCSDRFQVTTETNGIKGFESALQIMPDIIVSDVMMPLESGIELCRKLKSDIRTGHIPVLLLTAHNSEKNESDGLKSGADDFMAKPFSIPNLKQKALNMLETRKSAERKVASDFFEDKGSEGRGTGETFLDKVIRVILENLDNPEFGVTELAESLFISRTQLYRLFKNISAVSVNDFIKDVRLKKAHQFLLTGEHNVSEVAVKCGFNSQGYFSRCFEEKFGHLPSKIRAGKN